MKPVRFAQVPILYILCDNDSKINSSLVLIQARKNRPFIAESLLMGRKDSNQTNDSKIYFTQEFNHSNSL